MQQQIKKLIVEAIVGLQQNNKLADDISFVINVDLTKNSEHGDFYSNIAMMLAKNLRLNPMDLAKIIAAEIPINSTIKNIEVAKPGFINFHIADHAYYEVVNAIRSSKEKFGYSDLGKDKMVMVEFVSTNPTGPLHVGHGRGAAFGATISNLLEAMGFKVHREYYVNDAGRQMHVLALSIWLRYLEIDRKLPHFPESCYKGGYLIDIASKIKKEYGEALHRPLDDLYKDLPADASDGGDKDFYVDAMGQRAQSLLGEEDYRLIMQMGIDEILADIKEDLEEFGVVFDGWFLESHLVKNGDVQRGIKKLQDQGYVYTKDDALWFRSTDFGDEKDRVLVRANGQTTYFASDVGYHLNKYERAFDEIIDVFGSDHHGYAPRIKGFLKAMGCDTNKLKILLVQFAILYRGKQKVQMSTRSGEFVTLRKLREEVGNDAARFFYIMRRNDQHLDFDMELAKSQSADNPVYYIQYAHARICSVMRQLEEKGLVYDSKSGISKLCLLDAVHEKALLRRLARYPIVLHSSAMNHEPHVLANYLRELAHDFHTYYNAHQFIVEDADLRNARLCLIGATKQILSNGLILLGVSSPEVM
jgi:arginyl-tRNA synthetase